VQLKDGLRCQDEKQGLLSSLDGHKREDKKEERQCDSAIYCNYLSLEARA